MNAWLIAGALSLACVACRPQALPPDAQQLASPTMPPPATHAPEVDVDVAAPMTAVQHPRDSRHSISGVNPPADTPAEVIAAVDRAALCVHFAGEFNGDRSEHDVQVNETMTSLACETIKHDVATLQRRYPGLAALKPAIDAVDDL